MTSKHLLLIFLGCSLSTPLLGQEAVLMDLVSSSFKQAVQMNNLPYFKDLFMAASLSPQDASLLLVDAAKLGHAEIAVELINHNADINHNKGEPLKMAAAGGKMGMVQALLKHGADSELCDIHFLKSIDPAIAELISNAQKLKNKECSPIESAVKSQLNQHNNSYTETLCALACSKEYREVLPRLLAGAAKSDKLSHALIWKTYDSALKAENLDFLRALLDYGILPTVQEPIGDYYSTLMRAIEDGQTAVVKLFLTHPRIKDVRAQLLRQKNRLGETPLIVACSKRHFELEEEIHHHGQDEARARKLFESYAEIIGLLLENGADINDTDTNGWTAFTHAVCTLYMPIIDLLFEHPRCKSAPAQQSVALQAAQTMSPLFREVTQLPDTSDSLILNYQNDHGRTPIMLVAREGNIDAFRILLEREALLARKPRDRRYSWAFEPIQDKDGFTAYLHAAACGHENIMRAIYDVREERHISPNSEKNNKAQTAFHLAALYGHEEAVQTSLDNKTGHLSTNTYDYAHWEDDTDNDRLNPLQLAARAGHTGVINVLLRLVNQHGGRYQLKYTVNYSHYINHNTRGYTALHYAAEGGHLGAVKALCSYDANKDAICQGGFTACQLAEKAGKKDVAIYLAPVKKLSERLTGSAPQP